MSKIEWKQINNTARLTTSYHDCDFVIGLVEKAPLDDGELTKMMDIAISKFPEGKHYKQNGSFFEPVSDYLWDEIVSGKPIASRT